MSWKHLSQPKHIIPITKMESSNDSPLETHIGTAGRQFKRDTPIPCYDIPPSKLSPIPKSLISQLRALPLADRHLLDQIIVPPRNARAFVVPSGCLLRITVLDGPQVADVNIWNLHNPRERFYSSKTRQIHATHLSTGDSLWSCMPYLRPLATITADSVAYGIDSDNAGVHDVIGSRCDPYTHAMMTGEDFNKCCHSNLTRAVIPFNLTENDVHDVFNVFMRTGFMPKTGQYFTKPSPVCQGDFIEMFAHFDLLVAVGTCPQGDVSIPCGSDAEPKCYELSSSVYKVPDHLLEDRDPPQTSSYKGVHGLFAHDRVNGK